MSHAASVLADLEEVVNAGPLPRVLHIPGDYERPPLAAASKLPRLVPVLHDVWIENVAGVIERFPLLALPQTARDEALIVARGKNPGLSFNVSVRVAS